MRAAVSNFKNDGLPKAFPHFSPLFGTMPWSSLHDNAPIHTVSDIAWISERNEELLE